MYWIFATLYTFFTIIISQFLEKDVKYIFYLVMILLFVSLNNVYYSIRQGDTLWDIAKARGVSVEDLKSWNSQLNFNNMKPGQKIVVGKV